MPRKRQVAPARPKRGPHKTDYGPLKRLYVLTILVSSCICIASSASSHQTTATNTKSRSLPSSASRMSQHLQHEDDLLDPMEACYLANNRASESLTISESTPVGTVVGEIMVNGDSSSDGNIELSIKMPGGSGQPGSGAGSSFGFDSSRQPVGTQRQKQTTNGYYSAGNSIAAAPPAATSTSSNIARRIGPSRQNDSFANQQHIPSSSSSSGGNPSSTMAANTKTTRPKSARDLSNLIDLMPPLSIEPGSKRLILAKKLDRENLDRYIQAGGYQTSTSSGSLSQTSSASLTVHIKCQLRDRPTTTTEGALPSLMAPAERTPASNTTTSNLQASSDRSRARPSVKSQSSSSNSILIPVHLIVTDENDNWPTFIGSPYIIDLNESAQIGSLLQGNEIVAVDNDQQGPLSTIEYSIVAGSYWSDSFSFLNPLDSRSLVVKDNRLLDFESQPKMTLRVMASDQGDPPNWAITSLYINLLDQDDLNPVFNEDKYYGSVKENRPGEVIELGPRRMVAKDGDKNVNSPIIYSFHMKTNQSIHFDLDADLGRLSLKKSLAEESSAGSRQPFCLLIRATQVDNPNRWTLAMVNMRMPKVSTTPGGQLEDLLALQTEHTTAIDSLSSFASSNQSSPSVFKFAQSSYTLELSEAASPGSTILTVRAQWTGRDRPQDGDAVSYQLLDNEMGYFRLDEQTNRLILNRSVDYEMHRQLSVRVLATYEQYDDSRAPRGSSMRSGGPNIYPRLVCDITRVNVNIINKNEFTPEFSHEQYNFQLSVSDLIANFDQSKSIVEEGETSDADRRGGLRSFGRRFGDLELNGEDSSLDDLGYKALQLGQVFCADRDFGDKVTLQLTGSKANLFYLTQDGRLYLPLVNVSTIPAIANLQNRGISGESSNLAGSSSSSSPKVINNQFMLSRLFGTRRSDQSGGSLETMDGNYLNFLLAEISQLGRLRLKVLAHDDGQPESKQSQALIVVSILSIDNFILQRAPQLAQGDAAGAIHLSNEASYETNHNRLEPDAEEVGNGEARQQRQQPQTRQQQVMMIPSANGKSFVQINPDIINNLLSVHSDASRINNGTGTTSINRFASANASSDLVGLARSHSDSLELAASQAVSHSVVNAGEPSGAQGQQSLGARFQQPPSLLLVDDDGAKFVAMPAAIEVYNQQVQEAAAGQQARQRNQAYLNDPKRKSTRQLEQTNSIWSLWKNQFGFGDNNSQSSSPTGGVLYWINLSTAVLLHLAVLVIIITLATRFRASFGGSSNSSRQSDDSNLSNSSLWPRRFPKLSFHGGGGSRHPSVNILDHTSTSPGDVPFMISGGGGRPDCSDGYNFTHQRDNSNLQSDTCENNNNISSYHHRRQQSISSGVVVSAISKGYKAREVHSSTSSTGMHMSTGVNSPNLKQQNLFDHLKLTINRMLDIRDDKADGISGKVTIKPLDTESEVFTSCARDPIGESDRDLTTSSANEHLAGKATSSVNSTQLDSTGKSISTFVGNSSPQKNRRITKTTTRNDGVIALQSPNEASNKTATNATVVSINVKAPPSKLTVDTDPSSGFRSGGGRLKGSGGNCNGSSSSSSSSAVSLVSMSSSISNKISAAVQRSSGNTQTQTNSDTSSIDSATLFDSNGNSPTDRQSEPGLPSNQADASMPPVPPPLPPPPSLAQVGIEGSCSHLSPMQARKLSKQTTTTTPSQSQLVNRRRELPQNPVHLKLRQQAMSEQNVAVGGAAGRTDSPKCSPTNGRASSGRLQQQQTRPPTSTGGRREARAQANEHRALPPTPPPLPANGIITGGGLMTTTASSKTVSPTTSVDRGYESFQSYTSSSHQPLKYRQANQFSSLQEYDLVNSQPSYEPQNQAKHQPPPSASSFLGEFRSNQLARASNKLKLNGSTSDCRLSSSKQPMNGSKMQQTGGNECDTEDDDFYYCNNALDPANLSEMDVNHQKSRSATSIGSLLSDYASHTYKPSNGANKTATTVTTARKEARLSIQKQQQQQTSSKQQQRKPRTSSSDQQQQQQQQLHSTRVLVQGRNANNYQHIINTSNRITNDLISSSSSASSSSSPAITTSPAVNNNSSGSHQHLQQQQQHEFYHQSGCDILAQVNHSSTYQNYPLGLSTPSNHQHHRSGHHHHHHNHHHSLGCNNHHQQQQQQQQYLQHNQPQNQHQSLPSNHANNGGGGGKKQLTWSDQVEMAA